MSKKVLKCWASCCFIYQEVKYELQQRGHRNSKDIVHLRHRNGKHISVGGVFLSLLLYQGSLTHTHTHTHTYSLHMSTCDRGKGIQLQASSQQ
jgi:hypothetical protein